MKIGGASPPAVPPPVTKPEPGNAERSIGHEKKTPRSSDAYERSAKPAHGFLETLETAFLLPQKAIGAGAGLATAGLVKMKGTPEAQASGRPEIRQLQESINEWRAIRPGADRLPPIPTDGRVGKETEQALKDFQKSQGLKPADGKVNVATRERLRLETDQDFRRLEGHIKKRAREAMTALGNDEQALASLRRLVTDSTFRKAEAHQKQLIELHSKFPASRSQLGDVIENDSFRALGVAARTKALDMVARSAGTKNEGDVRMLATAPGLRKLAPGLQVKVLDIFRQRSIDAPGGKKDTPGLAENLRSIVDGGFVGLSEQTQLQILNKLENYAGSRQPGRIDNLSRMLAPGFQYFSDQSRETMLKALEASPDDAKLAAKFGRLVAGASPHPLDEVTQGEAIKRLLRFHAAGDEARSQKLIELVRSRDFFHLLPSEQKRKLEAL